jgi:threonine/homoserine/homoserine lactone efflux protein
MFMALISGLLLGLSAGLAPGPLMALVIAQSLRHGAREGCKVALAPLLTDAPIILLAMGLAARVSEFEKALGVLSVAGGLFVLYLAVDSFRSPRPNALEKAVHPKSWLRGALTNLLNLHPWLFWMTVGAATLAQALTAGWLAAVAFLATFYLLLVGSKVLLALVADRARETMRGRTYRRVMQTLGVLLAVFAVLLFRDGVKRLL